MAPVKDSLTYQEAILMRRLVLAPRIKVPEHGLHEPESEAGKVGFLSDHFKNE